MRVVNARDCQFADSRSSSVHGQVVDREVRAVRVDRWEIVRRCVRANGVRCIRRGICRLRVAVQWAQGVLEWRAVRWALDRDFRLRAQHRHVRVRVHRWRIAVRDSVTRDRAASKKGR